jgi:formate dehydrogenase maturation protein FdhE
VNDPELESMADDVAMLGFVILLAKEGWRRGNTAGFLGATERADR